MKTTLTLIAAVLLAPLVALHAAPAAKPNIIVVMPDDVGYGDYAYLGNPIMRTPVVDAFKKESMLFTQFHVSPTCSPCRSALMSGRHEFKNGVTHTILERERMNLKTYTLPQMLKSVGYTTGIFGKWHLGDEEAYRPESRGFDEVYIHGGGGIGQTYPGSCGDAPGNTKINPLKELYWKQFGGGPDAAMLKKMDPTKGGGGEEEVPPKWREQRKKRQESAAKPVNE